MSSLHAVHATTHHIMLQRTHLQQLQTENSEMSNLQRPLLDIRNKELEKLTVPVECPCPNELWDITLTFAIALICEHEDAS